MANAIKEYMSPTKLDIPERNYFVVPESVILDIGAGDKRLLAFSFFSMRRGLDLNVTFSINVIVKWAGRKQDRHANGINNALAKAIEQLEVAEYISLSDKPSNSSLIDATLNLSKITDECQQKKKRFAVIYVDELNKILGYKNTKAIKSKDSFFNNDTLLLVFVYLRMMINRRQNNFLPGEADDKKSMAENIEARRIRMPEVHNEYYCDIAEKLGLTARVVSDAVTALNELNLIYSESLPRVKHKEKWKTTYTLFCNWYKRENGNLLAEGSEYYITEIKNKKKQLGIIDKDD